MWSKSEPAAPAIASGYDTAAAKRYYYCRINAKHLNLQPQLRFYWLQVAVTVRDHCEGVYLHAGDSPAMLTEEMKAASRASVSAVVDGV